MGEYRPVIETLEATAIYDTPDLGDVTKTFDMVRVAVMNDDEVVWQKNVAEVFIFTGIPRPFFDRRIGKAVVRAHNLADRLNGIV